MTFFSLKQIKIKFQLGIGLFCYCLNANAMPDLIDIYQQSLTNDPTFKQAYHSFLAANEAKPQALSALLPALNANGNWNEIDFETQSGNPLLNGKVDIRYRQKDYALSINQPIFNYAAWVGLKQSDNSLKKALALYDDAQQSLMLRTATAYFNVLRAKDNVKYTKAQQLANGRSLDQVKQRFNVGLDAIGTVYEAQAAYDSSHALLIAAENNLKNQYESLRLITNQLYSNLAVLKSNQVPLIKPKPSNIEAWTDIATKQNYLLKASQYATYEAKQNISINNAGHLPTVNLSANYNHSNNNAPVDFLRSKTTTKLAKLTLNLPLYTGGLVLSKTRQATYNYQASHDALEKAYRSTIVNTRISFNTVIDGISTIKADKQAVKSAKSSLESISAQFKVGTRTMVDVVTYQKNLFQRQMQLSSDQYNYIIGILQLKYQAGTLSIKDIQKINRWLIHQ